MNLEEKLIKLVRAHKELYDLKDELYKDVPHKTKLWVKIGHKLNLNGEACRKRWIGLRSCYRRSKQSEIEASRSAATFPKKKWRYYDAMRFLDDVHSCRKNIGNIWDDTKHFKSSREMTLPSLPATSTASEPVVSPVSSLPSSPSGFSVKAAEAKIQDEDEIDSSMSSFLQAASTAVENVSTSFLRGSKQTTTEMIFVGLANALNDANLDYLTLNNIHQNVTQYVYEAIRESYDRKR